MTSVFSFEIPAASPATAISTSDPAFLKLPTEVDLASGESYNLHKASRIISLVLHRVHYDVRLSQPPSRLHQSLSRHSTRFYRLSLLRSDGSLWECLYTASAERNAPPIRPPNIRSRGALSQATIASHDGFIVPSSLKNSTDIQVGPSTRQKTLDGLDQKLSKTITLSWLAREVDHISLKRDRNQIFAELLRNIDTAMETRYASKESNMDLLYVQSRSVQTLSEGMLIAIFSGLAWYTLTVSLMMLTRRLLISVISCTI